jgi:hypothetical protein
VVVAKPVAGTVERDEKEVGALEVRKQATRARDSENGIARRRGEAIEDRRPEQKGPCLVGDGVEDLGCEVVGDVTVGRRELTNPSGGLIRRKR